MMRYFADPDPVAGGRRASPGKIERGRRGIGVILAISLLFGTAVVPALASATLPVSWTAGGLSAGTASAGQAGQIASDASGNVAVVSGPSGGRDLAVTSYTATGAFRWRSTVSPSSGTFVGDWVAAAGGNVVAVGHNIDSHGRPIGSSLVRFSSDGTLRWRVDLVALVVRLVVDTGGNAYLAFGAQDVQVRKYSPEGVLLWANGATGTFVAQSLALSPDQADVVLTGDVSGGATWMTAAFNAATGARRWQVTAAEGIAARDVVVDGSRVYVTGEGNVGINGFLTVVAYDRARGTRLWRTDANPPTCCAYGSRIALAPDGSVVVAGQTSSGGYFDWWIVAFEPTGAVRWQARRDAAISGDEIPRTLLTLADGTTVVSGTGGPVTRDILGNQYMQGVTVGYGPTGTLLWEAFAKLPTVSATALPDGDVCASGGYDALITCWPVPVGAGNPVLVSSISLDPTFVPGGSPSTGAVTLSGPAPTDLIVTLASSQASVAGVPKTVSVAQGASKATFTVTTSPVAAATSVGISATYAGLTSTATLTVQPPPTDTVAVTLAVYRPSKRQLTVQATSTNAMATLTAYVTATGQRIGTLVDRGGGSFSGQFSWPTKPQAVTVRSSLGGSDTHTVASK